MPILDGVTPVAERRRAATLVKLSGLAVLIAGAPLAGGVLGALVLAAVLDGSYRRLSARVGPNRGAALLLVGCLVLVFVPAVAIAHASLEQLRALDQGPGTAFGEASRVVATHAGDLGDVLDRVKGMVISSVASIATWFVGGAARGLLNLIIALLCLYFLLISGDAWWSRLRGYLPFSAESCDLLRSNLRRVTQATLLGSLLSAVLQGASMAVGFLIAGLSGAAFWGVITGFASLVPVLGTSIVCIPVALLLLSQHNIGGALVIVAFGWLLPDAIDKVARAKVSRRVGDVHPLTTLLGALIGVRLFGLVGLVAGPLMISLFFELLSLYERDYRPVEATPP